MRVIDADKIPWRRDYVSDDNMMMEHVVSKGDVDAMPTIDTVKHGHWIYQGPFVWYRCSVCRHESVGKLSYCGHCGARMDEVTE